MWPEMTTSLAAIFYHHFCCDAGMILALFGMSTMGTSIFSLIPLVLRELVGPENVTSGMGLQMVFQAFGFTASSFIAGIIYEREKV